jgi:hypothetical protein
MLEEFGCKYVVVPNADHETQASFLKGYLVDWFKDRTKHIADYSR